MMENIPIDSIVGSVCGWKGCQKAFLLPKGKSNGEIPKGWTSLVMSTENLLEEGALFRAEVDMVLCPKHRREMYGLLKWR
jgi:hypothetical protein